MTRPTSHRETFRTDRASSGTRRKAQGFLSGRQKTYRGCYNIRILIRNVAMTLTVECNSEGMINGVRCLSRDKVTRLLVACAGTCIRMDLARFLYALDDVEQP